VAASVVAASTAGVLAEGASELEASAGGSAEGLFEVPASEEDLLEAASSDDPASSDGPASSGERRSFLAVGAGAGAVAGASERSALEPSLPRRAGPWYQRLSAGNESGRAVPVGAVAGAEEAGAGADTTEEPEIRPRKRKRRQIARRAAAGLPGSLFSTARYLSRAPGRTHQRTPQAARGALLVPPEIPVVVWETASQPHPTLSLQGVTTAGARDIGRRPLAVSGALNRRPSLLIPRRREQRRLPGRGGLYEEEPAVIEQFRPGEREAQFEAEWSKQEGSLEFGKRVTDA
jgi:hypothetical protein